MMMERNTKIILGVGAAVVAFLIFRASTAKAQPTDETKPAESPDDDAVNRAICEQQIKIEPNMPRVGSGFRAVVPVEDRIRACMAMRKENCSDYAASQMAAIRTLRYDEMCNQHYRDCLAGNTKATPTEMEAVTPKNLTGGPGLGCFYPPKNVTRCPSGTIQRRDMQGNRICCPVGDSGGVKPIF